MDFVVATLALKGLALYNKYVTAPDLLILHLNHQVIIINLTKLDFLFHWNFNDPEVLPPCMNRFRSSTILILAIGFSSAGCPLLDLLSSFILSNIVHLIQLGIHRYYFHSTNKEFLFANFLRT